MATTRLAMKRAVRTAVPVLVTSLTSMMPRRDRQSPRHHRGQRGDQDRHRGADRALHGQPGRRPGRAPRRYLRPRLASPGYHARMDLLRPVIRPYPWGTRTAIAELQGRPVPAPGPEAALWMGAHPSAPSGVGWTTLDEVIAARSEEHTLNSSHMSISYAVF